MAASKHQHSTSHDHKVFPSCSWIRDRETGNQTASSLRVHNKQANNQRVAIYGSIANTASWTADNCLQSCSTGGIFGLEFSPDGVLLGAATEQQAIVFVDPLRSAEFAAVVHKAHTSCVNCIRFVDSRLFATCSDDHTVRLWDLRFLKRDGSTPVRSYRGHSNWVKNIEVVPDKSQIITSSFDNFIISWDLNDSSCQPRRLFHLPGLMRMRVTPDCDKMIVSTHAGYIFVVHNLDVDNMAKDLFGFKPYTYFIAHASGSNAFVDRRHIARFTASRNRTELICDFPETCEPDTVSSIVPHPDGKAFACRFTNMDDMSEWTCVHDLQLPAVTQPEAHKHICVDGVEPTGLSRRASSRLIAVTVPDSSADTSVRHAMPSTSRMSELTSQMAAGEPPTRRARMDDDLRLDESDSDDDNNDETLRILRHFNVITNTRELRMYGSPPNNRTGADDSATRTLVIRNRASANSRTILIMGSLSERRFVPHQPPGLNDVAGTDPFTGGLPGASTAPADNDPMFPLHRRLNFYTTEPRSGRGYIKEQAWSPDGRVLASPHGFGIRLLAFDETLSHHSQAVHSLHKPRPLHQLVTVYAHSNSVVSSKFSPHHDGLLATGCLSGKIAIYQMRQ